MIEGEHNWDTNAARNLTVCLPSASFCGLMSILWVEEHYRDAESTSVLWRRSGAQITLLRKCGEIITDGDLPNNSVTSCNGTGVATSSLNPGLCVGVTPTPARSLVDFMDIFASRGRRLADPIWFDIKKTPTIEALNNNTALGRYRGARRDGKLRTTIQGDLTFV